MRLRSSVIFSKNTFHHPRGWFMRRRLIAALFLAVGAALSLFLYYRLYAARPNLNASSLIGRHVDTTQNAINKEKHVLVFWRHGCVHCEHLFENLRSVEAHSNLPVIPASVTPVDSLVASPADLGVHLAQTLGIKATPTMLFVDEADRFRTAEGHLPHPSPIAGLWTRPSSFEDAAGLSSYLFGVVRLWDCGTCGSILTWIR
jgi:hypothetical protein